jgi:hypothetical protein
MNTLINFLIQTLNTLTKPPQPTPIIGVRVYRNDTDTETPCELIHLGIDHNGIDQWEIAQPAQNPRAPTTD